MTRRITPERGIHMHSVPPLLVMDYVGIINGR